MTEVAHTCLFPGCDEPAHAHEGFVVRAACCERHRPVFAELGDVVRTRVENVTAKLAEHAATAGLSLLGRIYGR